MLSIPHSLGAVPLTQFAAVLAFVLALVGGLLLRGKERHGLQAAAAGAVLVGWAALLPVSAVLRAAWTPRTGPEVLLVPATAAALLGLLGTRLRGRLGRWAPVMLAVFIGWWVAASPLGRAEFWRVWLIGGLLAWPLSRGIAEQPARGLASGLTLWGGLALAGSPSHWVAAGLVLAAAWAGLLPAGVGAAMTAPLVAAVIAGADLASGRLPHGAVGLVDLVCIGAVAAPALAAMAAPRLGKRFGAAGPALAAGVAAAIAVASAWIAYRALRP